MLIPSTSMTGPINLGPDEDDPTNDAGIFTPPVPLGSIGDRVFDDLDRDGIQDGNEPGVPGVTVQLKDCSGNVLDTQATDGNGNYLFNDLPEGCYTIGVVLPAGRESSALPTRVATTPTDSDVNPKQRYDRSHQPRSR